MRALNEHKQLLQDLEYLVNKMEQEIELLRNINYRIGALRCGGIGSTNIKLTTKAD